MLNVTNANVCAIIVVARSFFANTNGMKTHDSDSCGRKASDSACSEDAPSEEVRYRRMLYGEKLCRWSMRVRWWKKVCTRNGWP